MRFVFVALCLAAPVMGGEWNLVWSDEFNQGVKPDPAKWTYEEGFIRNKEEQFYTRENARVENGNLVIEALKSSGKSKYTSASLTTEGKAAWRYGRIEVRAQLPGGRGTWPAIWMLGVNHRAAGWPACGEIDIMENVGFEPDLIHANIHTRAYNHVKRTGKGSKITTSKPYGSFHVYALEWRADRMDFFVDDQKYFTYKNEQTGKDAWPFDEPQYLILNLAIGGAWGGRQGIDDGAFPQRYLIDYVRVYAEGQTKSTFAPPGYKLVFSDDFDGASLDANRWMYRTDVKLESSQRKENVTLEDGKLVIHLRKETHQGKAYTGGGVITKQRFRYGYYEARVKMHDGGGWHQSVWAMFGGDGSTTYPELMRTEIDGMEFDSDVPWKGHMGLIKWVGSNQSKGSQTCTPGVYRGALGFDATRDYHSYGFEWTAKDVRFYLDGDLRCVLPYPPSDNTHDEINFWLTAIAAARMSGAIDDAKLPGRMLVDAAYFYAKP